MRNKSFYERETSVMSRVFCLKAEEISRIHFLAFSRSLCFGGVHDTVS